MFYRLDSEHKIYDYSEKQYSPDCQYTDIITEQEYREHPNKVYVKEIQTEKEAFRLLEKRDDERRL